MKLLPSDLLNCVVNPCRRRFGIDQHLAAQRFRQPHAALPAIKVECFYANVNPDLVAELEAIDHFAQNRSEQFPNTFSPSHQ